MTAADLAAAPSDAVGFILQMAAIGGLLGTAYALVKRRQDPEADTWIPTAVGGVVVALIGLGFVLLEALL